MHREFLPVVLTLSSLLLCGCTGLVSGQSGEQPAATSEPGTQEAEFLRSELDEYLGVGDYSIEESRAAEEARYQLDLKREEALIACMAEQGFEYKSNVQAQESWEPEADTRTDRERAEQDGFDVFPMDRDMTPDPESLDPNKAALDAMSESELEAWARALHGDWLDADIEDLGPEDIEADLAAGDDPGCLERAAKVVEDEFAELERQYNGSWAALYGGQWDDLAEGIARLNVDIEDSPEVGELAAAWSTCMEQKGYRYEDKWEIMDYLFEKRDKIYGLDSLSGPDGRLAEDVEIPAPDPQLEAAAVKEERELAVANVDCREQVDYDAEYRRIMVAYENQFVKDHRELLEQFKAASSSER